MATLIGLIMLLWSAIVGLISVRLWPGGRGGTDLPARCCCCLPLAFEDQKFPVSYLIIGMLFVCYELVLSLSLNFTHSRAYRRWWDGELSLAERDHLLAAIVNRRKPAR